MTNGHAAEAPNAAHAPTEEGYLKMILSADIDCQAQFEEWAEDQEILCTIQFDPILSPKRSPEFVVGKIRARVIDRELAYACGWTDQDIFDQTSANWRIYEDVYRCQPGIPERIAMDLMVDGVESNANILVVDTVDILPKFRGLNYSLLGLRSLIQHFRLKVGLVVLLLLPSQFLDPEQIEREEDQDPGWLPQMGLESFPKDLRESRTRLERHFGKLGFSVLPETDFMIVDPMLEFPSIDSLRLKPGAERSLTAA